MKDPLLYSCNRSTQELSRDDVPRVVLEWKKGLSDRPAIYTLGNSVEECDEIRRLLEGLFDGRGQGLEE